MKKISRKWLSGPVKENLPMFVWGRDRIVSEFKTTICITEGEEKPEPEPEFVPPEACPVLIQAASPGEFIDKLGKLTMVHVNSIVKFTANRIAREVTEGHFK